MFVDGLRQFNIDLDTATSRAMQAFGLELPDEMPGGAPAAVDNEAALRELEGMLKGVRR